MMSDVRSLKDDGLIKDNNDIKLVSDFHPRHPIFGLAEGLFLWLFVTSLAKNDVFDEKSGDRALHFPRLTCIVDV